MTISTIEESEIPEYQTMGCLVHYRGTDEATGQTILVAAGHHPKLRITKAWMVPITYSTATDVIALEEATGTDHATGSCGTTVNIKTAMTITDDVFERNEAICINLTTDGNAANSDLIYAYFESIH